MNSRGFIHTFPKTFLFKFHARITFSLENRIFAFCNSESLLHFNLLCISTLKKTNYRSHISMHPFSIQSSRNNCVHFNFLLFHAEIQKKIAIYRRALTGDMLITNALLSVISFRLIYCRERKA